MRSYLAFEFSRKHPVTPPLLIMPSQRAWQMICSEIYEGDADLLLHGMEAFKTYTVQKERMLFL
ncbi:hypothetical protein GN244_ATG08445 [Phytophthora infestans]|uniref:Uncharacterized protein n=1 Tax=Phytophthora infestans TaxID=4787 RepID=A0A833SV95_PHYIN|nr:hypothetical protein GN244_ATG08445 [Phytophthora infestans]